MAILVLGGAGYIGSHAVYELIEAGLIAGGMVPKVRSCLRAVEHGVGEVCILNGGTEHALLLGTLAPDSLGTTMTKD